MSINPWYRLYQGLMLLSVMLSPLLMIQLGCHFFSLDLFLLVYFYIRLMCFNRNFTYSIAFVYLIVLKGRALPTNASCYYKGYFSYERLLVVRFLHRGP